MIWMKALFQFYFICLSSLQFASTQENEDNQGLKWNSTGMGTLRSLIVEQCGGKNHK